MDDDIAHRFRCDSPWNGNNLAGWQTGIHQDAAIGSGIGNDEIGTAESRNIHRVHPLRTAGSPAVQLTDQPKISSPGVADDGCSAGRNTGVAMNDIGIVI